MSDNPINSVSPIAKALLLPLAPVDHRALAQAGVNDPGLRQAYRCCRDLLLAHEGWASGYALWALPPQTRPHAWALYGFARRTDAIIDDGDPATRTEEFRTWRAQVEGDLRAGRSDHPVCRALLHTLHTYDIDPDTVHAYLDAMWTSLTTTTWATYADLYRYVEAVNCSVGRQVLALLGPRAPEATERMDALSAAMYLTDILTDLGEDLRWGRLYLPADELAEFGVIRRELERGEVTPAIRELLRFQVDRVRQLYNRGMEVVDMVEPASRLAVRCGAALFREMLDDIERRDFDVFATPPRAGWPRMVEALLRAGLPAMPARLRNRRTATVRQAAERR
ncbi:farnesyl-diphosphate farnesyltransferase [Lentzea atacamensis]|uniref:Farnesyl-diphosphate farnesyltransferase n=1 Tax=Lentzea atacamensis TaxID=531938 RepID=A0A316HF03_9PSEU|nr:squalene/phytoene synthase family protein [Lentzea atacamensis]PWK78611.1 farnesyl-diphosphate farnesyltransferase [Lentzea atacamensis]